MSANLIVMDPNCRKCHQPLTLEEMHYFDEGDGQATCSKCETQWMTEMQEWKDGKLDVMPER